MFDLPEDHPGVLGADEAWTLGAALEEADRPIEAIEYFRKAANLYGAEGRLDASAFALTSMADIYNRLERPQVAILCGERALKLLCDTQNREGQAAVLALLANAYRAIGRRDRAMECFAESIRIARETGM